MLPNSFWTSNSQLHSFLWGIDQWVALQVGQQVECLEIRCTFDEVEAALVANRTLCLRRGADRSVVRLFHQEQALGVIDLKFRQHEDGTSDDGSPPPFTTIHDSFRQTFPYVATRLIHPQAADLHQIAQAVAAQTGVLGQLEINSTWSDHQNADVRIAARQWNASLWRAASHQRWVA